METKNQSNNGVLIINPPGELQIGLQALLTSHLDLDVLVVSEIESAIKIIWTFNPSLIILDQNISKKDPVSLVSRIKNSWPEILCLVLVNDDASRQLLEQTDADLIIVKGLIGADLVKKIRILLGETLSGNR